MFDSTVLCKGPPTAVHSFIPPFFIDILTRFLSVSLDLPTPRLLTVHLPQNAILSEIIIAYSVYPQLCATQKRQILEMFVILFQELLG